MPEFIEHGRAIAESRMDAAEATWRQCLGQPHDPADRDTRTPPSPEVFDPSIPPGGWVCAVPDTRYEGGICGMPVESEPCDQHPMKPTAWAAPETYGAFEQPSLFAPTPNGARS